MTDYTITTDFGAKDSLPSGNAAKVIKGSEFTTEFTNILTAVNSKVDSAGDTFTGAVIFDAAVTLNADVTFDTNTMFVDVSENRVGIGNVAPATALDVTGVITTDGLTSSAGIDITGTVTASGLTVDTNTLHVDATNDRVGIGTTSPLKDLNVSNTTGSSEIMISTSDTGTGSLEFGDVTSGAVARGFLKYNHSDNSLQFGSAQTERMRIDSSGNVGIGTTNPDSMLHVRKNQTADTAVEVSNLGTAGASTSSSFIVSESEGVPKGWFRRYRDGTSRTAVGFTENLVFEGGINSSPTERMRIDSSGNVGIGTTSPAEKLSIQDGDIIVQNDTKATFGFKGTSASTALAFRDRFAGVDRLTIDASGNVGIGTDSPDYPLEVSKAGTSGTGTIGLVPDSDNGHYIRYGGSGTNNNVFRLLGTGNTERMRIDASGKVGIGTTSPSKAFHVKGNDASILIQDSQTSYALQESGVILTCSATDGTPRTDVQRKVRLNGDALTFTRGPSDTEHMRIDTSGNLLVGKTSGGALGTAGIELRPNNLYVTSTSSVPIYANRNTNDGEIIQLRKDNSTVGSIGTASSGITFASGGSTERMRIDSSGNVLVGRTSGSAASGDNGIVLSPLGFIYSAKEGTSAQTHIGFINNTDATATTVGTIRTSGSTTSYNTSSDERLKENIQDADDAGSKIDAIQIRQFDWIADGLHQDYGVIAQELVEVAPEAVSEGDTEEDMMGVDYSKLVPMLIKEVQTLRNRVAQLENN